MMKVLVAVVAGCAGVAAMAQTTAGGIGMNSPNYSTYQLSVAGMNGRGLSETPSMRKQKLERAVALRQEADTLLAQDGGKLTPEHEAYVRRKVCTILGSEDRGTGSLAPRRRCGA